MTDIAKIELRMAQLKEQLEGITDGDMHGVVESEIAELEDIANRYYDDVRAFEQEQNQQEPVIDAASNDEAYNEYVAHHLKVPEELAAGQGFYETVGTDGSVVIPVDGKYLDLPL